MQRYKIGEIAKMLDVSVETVRYLEQMGLITSVRNPTNNYRYYDIWAANQILTYKKLRKTGFSSKEAVKMVRDGTIKNMVDQLDEQRREADYLAQYYSAKAIKYQNFQILASNIHQMVGKFFVVCRPAHYSFYICSYERDGLHVSEANHVFAELTEHFSFVEHIFRIKQSWFQSPEQSQKGQFGLTIKKRWADTIGLKCTSEMEWCEATTSVFTAVRLGAQQFFGPELLEDTFRFMKQNNLHLQGDITSIYLATEPESGHRVRYLELWVPIAETDFQSPPSLDGLDSEVLRQLFD